MSQLLSLVIRLQNRVQIQISDIIQIEIKNHSVIQM
jgi:hypothetical protein